MFERIGRGWGIAKISWAALKRHPKLLLFPVLSGVAFLALITVIGTSVFMQPYQSGIHALDFAFYFASCFIFIASTGAFVLCVRQSIAGTEPSLRAGLATVARRPLPILWWTFIAAFCWSLFAPWPRSIF